MPRVDDYTCSEQLRAQVQENIDNFADRRQHLIDRRKTIEKTLTHAAVALTIYDCEGESALILTKRSPHLKDHKGQWAIPGGSLDENETVIDAALRELREEVGLELPESNIMGSLDDYITRSGFVITPVVVWAGPGIKLIPDPVEVESIHPMTFSQLAREDSPNLESIPESDRQVLSMNFHDSVVYAPTAAMLYQFREVAILNQPTRVAHFDQPVFAWK